MTAAIYVRVSTDEQAREGLSLAVQEQRCRAAAEADGATDVRLYCDDGFSGTTLLRPGFQQLLADLAGHHALYVLSTDRLCRNATDFGLLIRTLEEADVDLRPVTDTLDLDTAGGRLSARIRADVDEFQVDQTREKVIASLDYRAGLGLHHGPPPFGYRLGAGDDPIEPEPDLAPIVRSLYDRYARGASLRQLAQWLNAERVPQVKHGRAWDTSTVRNILVNETYLGRVRWRGEMIAGRHEPLVTARLWRSVQRRRRARSVVHPRMRDQALAPLLRCRVCDGLMVLRRRDGRQHARYACHRRLLMPVGERHEPVGVVAPALEAVIWAHATELVRGGDIAHAVERVSGATEVAAADEELAAVELALERNLDAYHAGAVPLELLVERNAPLMVERGELQARCRGT